MTAEAGRSKPARRSCSRCAAAMEAVTLRSGRVWRCPTCRRLEI